MLSRGFLTIFLLIVSNVFMTLAWYLHLRLRTSFVWFRDLPVLGVILFSWSIAFFEYCCQVPANRLGFTGAGGPFSLLQLKVIQEVISLIVFLGFSVIAFHDQRFAPHHFVGLFFLVLAVYFIFKS